MSEQEPGLIERIEEKSYFSLYEIIMYSGAVGIAIGASQLPLENKIPVAIALVAIMELVRRAN